MTILRPTRQLPAASQRSRRRQRGSTTVEFALVVPLLFVMIFGIFEFTRIMMVKQGMTNAAREGCRKASLLTTTKTTDCENAVRDRLEKLVVGANDPQRVEVKITPPIVAGLASQTPITTSISVPYKDVSILPGWLSGSKQVTVSATMYRE